MVLRSIRGYIFQHPEQTLGTYSCLTTNPTIFQHPGLLLSINCPDKKLHVVSGRILFQPGDQNDADKKAASV